MQYQLRSEKARKEKCGWVPPRKPRVQRSRLAFRCRRCFGFFPFFLFKPTSFLERAQVTRAGFYASSVFFRPSTCSMTSSAGWGGAICPPFPALSVSRPSIFHSFHSPLRQICPPLVRTAVSGFWRDFRGVSEAFGRFLRCLICSESSGAEFALQTFPLIFSPLLSLKFCATLLLLIDDGALWT